MKRTHLYKGLLVLAGPVLVLTAIELGLRVVQTGHIYLRESSPHYMRPEGFSLKPNFKGWWHGARYEINSNGFRMPADVQNTTNRLRVIALGDSVTEGYCVTDVSDLWPMQLQDKLNAETPDSAYVINTGVAAWNLLVANPTNGMESGQYVRFLAENAAQYEPDIIIYCLCMNDIPGRVNNLFEIENAQNKSRFRIFPEQWRAFLKRKAFYRLARDWYREQKFYSLDFSTIPTPEMSEEYWDRVSRELADLKKASETLNAKFVCIIWPYSYQLLPANRDLLEINKRLKLAMQANSTPFIDMTDLMNETNVLSYYVLGDYIHPNTSGHELIAEAATLLLNELPDLHMSGNEVNR
jgi:lysophospholipase L1-like esterase